MTVASPIDMGVFEKAVADWFLDATGLVGIWTSEASPQIVYPFATLSIISGPLLASPMYENRYVTNLANPLGEEVEITKLNTGSITVSCQTYVERPGSAIDYLNKASLSLELNDSLTILRAADIVVNNVGSVTPLGQLINNRYIDRASIDLFLTAPMTTLVKVGYIKTVDIESPSLGISGTFGDV